MISFSLAASRLSISLIASSVAFCTSASWRFSSSSADGLLLQQLLQHVDAVAADVAHRDAGVLGVFVRDLDHLLAALLVELGDADAQHLPSIVGDRPRLASRIALSTALTMPLVPDRDGERARLGHADRGDLSERLALAIGLDLDRLEQRGAGAAGAQAAEFVFSVAWAPCMRRLRSFKSNFGNGAMEQSNPVLRSAAFAAIWRVVRPRRNSLTRLLSPDTARLRAAAACHGGDMRIWTKRSSLSSTGDLHAPPARNRPWRNGLSTATARSSSPTCISARAAARRS